MAKVYQEIASLLQAISNCEKAGNAEWRQRHGDAIRQIERDILPSGSGIDKGTKIDFERSSAEKIVLTLSFHHIDELGGYDGWTDHEVIVKPSLAFGITLRITGRDRNMIKDYLHEVYEETLTREVLSGS